MLEVVPRTMEKERPYFKSSNHERIMAAIRAGRDPDLLKNIPPIFLNLDLTWRCNYNCIGCIDEDIIERGHLTTSSIKNIDWKLCEDLLNYAEKSRLLGFIIQGAEPLLFPQIDEFLLACADRNLVIRLVTNGSHVIQHSKAILAALQKNGASLRVSINANRDNYQRLVKSNEADYDTVLEGIRTISNFGGKVIVSTVVFGKSFGAFTNIDQLGDIARDCMSSGASMLILLPGRSPIKKSMLNFNESEIAYVRNFAKMEEAGIKILLGNRFFLEETVPASKQYKNFAPCPTGLMRVVVGADANLYTCTEHRGENAAIIGRITKGKSFAEVWHSRERAVKQIAFNPSKHCNGITCDRYGLNTTVEIARNEVERSQNTDSNIFLPSLQDNVGDPFF